MTLPTYLGLALTGLVAFASSTSAGPGGQPVPGGYPPSAASLVADTTLNPLKIVYFGSSVPYGQGATNKYGYPARYTTLLGQRAAAGQGAAWQTVNISVPGDNTVKALARWQRDLLPQRGRYVVLALSLGNEGIHGGGRPVFDQFRTNLGQLIGLVRAQGMVPVVANCYTRNDYTPEDYSFIKEMNLLLHAWAVPSLNLLGAVDDGTGHWVPGYWDDALHPNDRGHAELAHALVPSLFDALRAGKALPHKVPTAAVRLARRGPGLTLRPEALVHPFTQVVSFRTAGTGRLLMLQDSTTQGIISLNAAGIITYKSAKNGVILGKARVNDNRWHQLVLTHYYALGRTVLYLDGTEVGRLPEQLLTRQLSLGGAEAPPSVGYRNWLFYRAGMNPEEVRALAADSLLKSSLELYAPLSGGAGHPDSLANLAQSTNQVQQLPAVPVGKPAPRRRNRQATPRS